MAMTASAGFAWAHSGYHDDLAAPVPMNWYETTPVLGKEVSLFLLSLARKWH